MQAMVYRNYGSPDVLQLAEVPRPVPGEGEVLIRVHAASVNAADWRLLTANIFLVRLNAGFWRPRRQVLGRDFAGRVEAVGKGVQRFRPGDAVFGTQSHFADGAFADYVCVAENLLEHKPGNLSFEEAAATPLAGITALQGLRDMGGLQRGQQVLIQGASGGVGTFAVQLAKSFGAEVTAVCSSRNVEMARRLGADHVLDYTRENFTTSGKRFDVILAINGYHPLQAYRRALKEKGRYVMVGGSDRQIFEALLQGRRLSRKDGQQFGVLTLQPNPADLPYLRQKLEMGEIRPVLDRTYTLSQLPEAMRSFGEGRTRGKLVITMHGSLAAD
ncbi:NAD(P)-dependent alcohol dehydrogenase [Deinococcus cellulosilyticus]|uniref:NADPH:quinone reductase n=1 Tax=Deinococcus cellulosilyticus (strain DSM 18568 / NBRC 106333 / KACC 11606 / 5516J-15) TaxID=1223518 RepID=A0A511MWJ6_DEIC1|nr:NAD(P)-dependent alcohol dehydrogenase [Deinococcus cellulosilyticus]GEM44547.1 NADPH:quinone reductase [Deinococcus cellulosilyticus NBRC 106333 = KACC 11606]